ncbi:hypothetical protein L873DRAFT_1842683 [Choiromyces venosus 120613-1]|uniref:Uncharacterized protein n=1 Tax=Choiromyces venosus 120613-1 TaxID=1336337 RepID=A0A3N4JRR8_9PEZI|nr:hypothetical protein L873DRAFT_1842683 [Choiromyces venosus 120613-1]
MEISRFPWQSESKMSELTTLIKPAPSTSSILTHQQTLLFKIRQISIQSLAPFLITGKKSLEGSVPTKPILTYTIANGHNFGKTANATEAPKNIGHGNKARKLIPAAAAVKSVGFMFKVEKQYKPAMSRREVIFTAEKPPNQLPKRPVVFAKQSDLEFIKDSVSPQAVFASAKVVEPEEYRSTYSIFTAGKLVSVFSINEPEHEPTNASTSRESYLKVFSSLMDSLETKTVTNRGPVSSDVTSKDLEAKKYVKREEHRSGYSRFTAGKPVSGLSINDPGPKPTNPSTSPKDTLRGTKISVLTLADENVDKLKDEVISPAEVNQDVKHWKSPSDHARPPAKKPMTPLRKRRIGPVKEVEINVINSAIPPEVVSGDAEIKDLLVQTNNTNKSICVQAALSHNSCEELINLLLITPGTPLPDDEDDAEPCVEDASPTLAFTPETPLPLDTKFDLENPGFTNEIPTIIDSSKDLKTPSIKKNKPGDSQDESLILTIAATTPLPVGTEFNSETTSWIFCGAPSESLLGVDGDNKLLYASSSSCTIFTAGKPTKLLREGSVASVKEPEIELTNASISPKILSGVDEVLDRFVEVVALCSEDVASSLSIAAKAPLPGDADSRSKDTALTLALALEAPLPADAELNLEPHESTPETASSEQAGSDKNP